MTRILGVRNLSKSSAMIILGLASATVGTHAFKLLTAKTKTKGPEFAISFPREVHSEPLDGRLFLLISRPTAPASTRPVLAEDDLFSTMPAPTGEPRFEINDHSETQQMFAIDVEGLVPETPGLIDATALGYPLDRLDQIPSGDYDVQGLLNVYETFHRADGHTVKLPMDQGEGQKWN